LPAIYLPPWRIDLSVRAGVVSPVSSTAIARVAARALDAGRAPRPASLAVILSDDAELAALNREHMGHEGPTDVLSFPMLPPAAYPPHPGRAATDGEPAAFVLPPGRRPHLGDVVISVATARKQAEQGRGGQTGKVAWSVADEMHLLVTHGVLHVCGWDHAQPEERDAMRALEQEVLR
jgi:probable rRNA maturation factor